MGDRWKAKIGGLSHEAASAVCHEAASAVWGCEPLSSRATLC